MTIVIGNLEDVFSVSVVLVAISVFFIIFCLIRGKGALHKTLVFFISLLGVVAIICFGGQAILTCFGMGWRCTPFNTMLLFGSILFIVILCFGMCELIVLKGANPVMVGCGLISMLLVITITLLWTFIYFHSSSWNDGLTTYNDQTIVYANDSHGGSCSWRYYDHINSLVHGAEITAISDWRGYPPRPRP